MSIDNKFIHSVKSQGSMEYILIISAIAIVIVVAIAFVLLTGGKATSSGSYKGEILNATMVYSPAGDNIGPGNLSNTAYPITEYLLLATNYPLPTIPKNATVFSYNQGYPIYSNYFLVDFSTDYYPGYNEWGVPYNQGNITEVYSQNGEYVYAVNFTYWTNDYLHSELPINYVGIWNLNTNKTTVFISNPKPLKVNFVETNSSYVSLLPNGNIGKNVSDNVTFIETGLPIGSSFTLSYYNLSQSSDNNYYDYAVDNAIINVNSTKMTITTKATQGYYLDSSVSGQISYNGIIYYVTPNSSYYTAGSTIYYNYYTSSTTPLKYTLNKPLVDGAEITFNLPNSTYYYPENPFSNLEVSVSNTIANGGTQINAFVANYTTTSITLNLGNIPSSNIQTVYLNFLPAGQIGSDLWFSPEYSSSNPGVITTPPTGIFSSYSDNNGHGYQPSNMTTQPSFASIQLESSSLSTNYIVGINEHLNNINSIGFDINNDSVPLEDINDGSAQAPYNGTYDMGSDGHIFIGIPTYPYGNPPINTLISNKYSYIGPMIFNYSLSGNTITLNTEIEENYYSFSYSSYLITPGVSIYLDDFYGDETSGDSPLIYYYATSPNNVFSYTTTGMTIV